MNYSRRDLSLLPVLAAATAKAQPDGQILPAHAYKYEDRR